MHKLNKIFVIIDPTTNNQFALVRATEIAKRRKAEIFAYLCIYSAIETDSPDELKEVELARHKPWLEKHLKVASDQGIKVKYDIVWEKDWRKVIGKAAKKEDADLIIKPSNRNPNARKLKMLTSDWILFETASCPVMLINAATKDSGKLLMAVDINRADTKYKEILDLVIEHSQSVANARGAELHVVNAYIDQDDYVHVSDVAKRVGVPSKQVHVVGAQPEQAILQVAKKINAEMVILGLSTKSKLASRISGFTSEWLLNHLSQDLFVIIPKKT